MCVWGGGGDVEAVLQCTTRITRVLGEGLCFGVCGFFSFLGGGGGGILTGITRKFLCVLCSMPLKWTTELTDNDNKGLGL